jgi:DNA (cytosine-5)-methyltransferase 1
LLTEEANIIIDDDDNEIQYLNIDDDDEDESLRNSTQRDVPFPKWIELPSAELPWGTVKKGETVELKSRASPPGRLISGDFLRVTEIIEYLETEETKLRGQLFQRTAYHRPQFGIPEPRANDGKAGDLNEVFMLVRIHPNDPRAPNLRNYEEIGLEDVIGKRELVVTNTPFPILSFRDIRTPLPRPMDKSEAKKYLFKHGRLVCRWIYICFLSRRGTCYEAEIRAPYKRECDELPDSHRVIETPTAKHCQRANPQGEHTRTSFMEINNTTFLQKPQHPRKHERLTFADFFCGAGLATQGAIQAGLKPVFAVEKFDRPAEAYAANFPGVPLPQMDVSDFVQFADRRNFRPHICHFSCPCQYWSGLHTREGKNDLDNIRCTYVPSPIAEKLKPPILTFEQAPGFCLLPKHGFFFREFINSLIRIGYNVRWKVQDLVEYGVPSRRRRLLVIAAKKGIPLPPFPRPTHGGPGTGLKPFKTLYEAEEPLRHQHRPDQWHNPTERRKRDEEPFDPRTNTLKGVLTTDGGEKSNWHWSGKRSLTVREAAYYQCCPPGFQFAGSQTDAMVQVGNGYPCSAAEQHFLSCAQTLEAFYNGFIDAEDDIKDLYETLRAKGIQIPQQQSPPRNLFENTSLTSPRHRNANQPSFRYLTRLVQTDAVGSKHDLWSRKIDLGRPEPAERRRNKRPAVAHGLIEISDDEGDSEVEFVRGPFRGNKRMKTKVECNRERETHFWDEYRGKPIELDD